MFFSSLCAPLIAIGVYTAGVLAALAVYDTTHDPSAARDLTRSGARGLFTDPPNLSTHVDTGGTPKDFYANGGDIVSIELPRDLAAAHPNLHEPIFRSCSPKDKSRVTHAVETAMGNAAMVVKYLETSGNKSLYRRWFGPLDEARETTVKRVFSRLSQGIFKDFVFVCNCDDDISIVIVEALSNPMLLHFCTHFWGASPNFQARILIGNEAQRRGRGNLRMHTAGRGAAIALARNAPGTAVRNVGSYLEFLSEVVASQPHE